MGGVDILFCRRLGGVDILLCGRIYILLCGRGRYSTVWEGWIFFCVGGVDILLCVRGRYSAVWEG